VLDEVGGLPVGLVGEVAAVDEDVAVVLVQVEVLGEVGGVELVLEMLVVVASPLRSITGISISPKAS